MTIKIHNDGKEKDLSYEGSVDLKPLAVLGESEQDVIEQLQSKVRALILKLQSLDYDNVEYVDCFGKKLDKQPVKECFKNPMCVKIASKLVERTGQVFKCEIVAHTGNDFNAVSYSINGMAREKIYVFRGMGSIIWMFHNNKGSRLQAGDKIEIFIEGNQYVSIDHTQVDFEVISD